MVFEFFIPCLIDLSHAAATDQADDAKAPAQNVAWKKTLLFSFQVFKKIISNTAGLEHEIAGIFQRGKQFSNLISNGRVLLREKAGPLFRRKIQSAIKQLFDMIPSFSDHFFVISLRSQARAKSQSRLTVRTEIPSSWLISSSNI